VSNVHSEASLALLYVQSAKARALAEAGIHHAILGLIQPQVGNQWPVNGAVQQLDFGGRKIEVAIRDATGLVDLNLANAKLLEGLFSVTGLGMQQQLTGTLLDWRDPDDLLHLHGMEDDDYQAAGLAWTARDAAFSSIEELRYLIGMTPEKFAAVEPFVTVHSGQAALNLDYAPRELINIIAGQSNDTASGKSTRRPTGRQSSGRPASRDGTYHIYAGASGNGDVFASVEAVVNISASAESPYTVLNWHEPARFDFQQGD
jgi:general secretion pathway protein K